MDVLQKDSSKENGERQKNLLEALADAFIESLEQGLEKAKRIREAYREMPVEAKASLELRPEDLDRLPWKLFKEGHRAGWIFREDAPPRLAELIQESESGKVPIGEFEYKISDGTDRQFINRYPIK